jgi:hypothetical protein
MSSVHCFLSSDARRLKQFRVVDKFETEASASTIALSRMVDKFETEAYDI